MDTKELVERLNDLIDYLGLARGHEDEIATVGTAIATIERLERERDELLNDIRIGCSNIERAESEAATPRARVARLEEAMEALILAGNDLANCAYNLSQVSFIASADRSTLRALQEAWDKERRSLTGAKQ